MNDTAAAILKSMAAKRISREELAHRAGISVSSLHKILAGSRDPSYAQLVRVGNALELELTEPSRSIVPSQIAPDEFGAYTRAAVRWMEGAYLAIRHSFNQSETIVAYAVTVEWDDEAAVLHFVSSDDFTGPALQRGKISFSIRTGHSYLLSSELGRFDLTILGRPADEGRLLGLSTTAFLHMGKPTPASSAITLVPVDIDGELPICGPVTPDDPHFASYSEWLRSAERDGFARVVSTFT